MRLDEENKRTHYLSVMQQTNTQFVNELNRKIDLIMDLKNDDERRAEMRSLNQLCQQYHYDTEKTETAQWQKNTDAEFIAALQNICPALTPKEQHICSLIRIRLQTKEIAVKLNASTETIKWHRKHIRKKLDIEDNESLTVFLSKIADRA